MRHALLNEEISQISAFWMRQEVENFLDTQVPEYFWHIPASSSGKYHPTYALGEEGLVRHTKAAVKIAVALLSLEQYRTYFTQEMRDAIIAALILHDTFKSGISQESNTKFSHPLIASQAVRSSCSTYFADLICPMIESHMGEWNISKYEEGELPKPLTDPEKFVHMCDYLASRKFLEVIFEE